MVSCGANGRSAESASGMPVGPPVQSSRAMACRKDCRRPVLYSLCETQTMTDELIDFTQLREDAAAGEAARASYQRKYTRPEG